MSKFGVWCIAVPHKINNIKVYGDIGKRFSKENPVKANALLLYIV
jgi:hypothetical protein